MALCRVCEKEQHFLDNNCDDDDWDDDWFDIPDDRPEDYPDWDGDESIMYLIDHCFEEDDEDIISSKLDGMNMTRNMNVKSVEDYYFN